MPALVTETQLQSSPVSAEGIELLGFNIGAGQRHAMPRAAVMVHDDVAVERVWIVGQGSHQGEPREIDYSVVAMPWPSMAAFRVCQARMAHLMRVGYAITPASISKSPSRS